MLDSVGTIRARASAGSEPELGRLRDVEALRKWADLLGSLLREQFEGVCLVSAEGEIRYANDSVCRILGLAGQEVRTIYDAFLKLFPAPQEMTRATCLWAEGIQRSAFAEHTLEITRGDGERRWVRFSQAPMGEEGFVLRARDVTAEKEEEEGRILLEEQLLQAQKMEAVGTLAGGMAHDMNNILGVIMGFASVLQQSEVEGATRARCVEGILAAARRGRDLAGNLLGFARKGSFRKTRVSLNEIILELEGLLRRTVPRSIEIRLELVRDLVPVEADAAQISQALMNLCINAVEAVGDRGYLTISTRNIDVPQSALDSWVNAEPGRYAQVVVSDDGVGMDRETLGRVFEPFFTTKPKGQGTGLGLSMVYGTVMNHKGDIRIRSEAGKGTSVILVFPEASVDASVEVPEQRRVSVPLSSPPARVLLVDDDRLMRQAGKVLLGTLGHSIHLAQGGREGVQLFQRYQSELDLVILDLVMPDMDGFETFHALRNIRPDVPVLLCSGYPREQRVEELIASGAAGFLRKPFDIQKLAQELGRILRGSTRQGSEP